MHRTRGCRGTESPSLAIYRTVLRYNAIFTIVSPSRCEGLIRGGELHGHNASTLYNRYLKPGNRGGYLGDEFDHSLWEDDHPLPAWPYMSFGRGNISHMSATQEISSIFSKHFRWALLFPIALGAKLSPTDLLLLLIHFVSS